VRNHAKEDLGTARQTFDALYLELDAGDADSKSNRPEHLLISRNIPSASTSELGPTWSIAFLQENLESRRHQTDELQSLGLSDIDLAWMRGLIEPAGKSTPTVNGHKLDNYLEHMGPNEGQTGEQNPPCVFEFEPEDVFWGEFTAFPDCPAPIPGSTKNMHAENVPGGMSSDPIDVILA
jgi:hypothetical protein